MSIETKFPIEIQRTDRKKSATIKVIDQRVIVTIPKTLSDIRLQDLVRKKTPWIRQKLKEDSNLVPVKPKEYVNGENFPYMGRNYRLRLLSDAAGVVKLKNGYLCVPASKKRGGVTRACQASVLIEDWYRQHALERLSEKTERYSELLGVQPVSIKVRDYKSRWGSCSVSGEITYNWRIIIAPHRIVDYVVVHELCHMLEHNHSPKFWDLLAKTMPDYAERREWLRLNGRALVANFSHL